MSGLLVDPTTVLVVGEAGLADWLRPALLPGECDAVERVGTTTQLRRRLDGAVAVGPVVAGVAADERDVLATVKEWDPDRPVFAVLERSDAGDVLEFTRAGGTAAVLRDEGPEALRPLVDEAIRTYDRRRTDALDASILQTLLEKSGISIYAKDVEGRHVRASKVPGGYSPERLRGQTDLDVYGEKDKQRARQTHDDDMRVIEAEAPIIDKLEHFEFDDQRDYYSRTTKLPWYDRTGTLQGLVGISWNVTDYVQQKKRLERQEDRIEEFASYVSHDLRNPLQVAAGSIELAREAVGVDSEAGRDRTDAAEAPLDDWDNNDRGEADDRDRREHSAEAAKERDEHSLDDADDVDGDVEADDVDEDVEADDVGGDTEADDVDTDAAGDALAAARDAVGRIDEMVDDLSTLAREGIDTGTYVVGDTAQPRLEGTELVALVREIWQVVGVDQATLTTSLDADAVVEAPESTLRPILENLLRNAILHAGPAVRVRVGALPDGGFYVADDGPGIPAAERESVLERGYTTADQGSGMGLHIVLRFVDRHDWEFVVGESEWGGARFEVRNCPVVARPSRVLADGQPVELREATDVGDVGIPGRANVDETTGEWTVAGAGSNIWKADNDFHFVSATVEGSARVQARVVEMDDVSEYSKAGVMVRGDTDADAPYGYVGLTPRHGSELLWRTRRGDDGISQHVVRESDGFAWYRVDRVGDTVTTSVSTDGDDWHPVDQRQVALDETVTVGLVVCSVTPQRLCEATFADVSVLAGNQHTEQ